MIDNIFYIFEKYNVAKRNKKFCSSHCYEWNVETKVCPQKSLLIDNLYYLDLFKFLYHMLRVRICLFANCLYD